MTTHQNSNYEQYASIDMKYLDVFNPSHNHTTALEHTYSDVDTQS